MCCVEGVFFFSFSLHFNFVVWLYFLVLIYFLVFIYFIVFNLYFLPYIRNSLVVVLTNIFFIIMLVCFMCGKSCSNMFRCAGGGGRVTRLSVCFFLSSGHPGWHFFHSLPIYSFTYSLQLIDSMRFNLSMSYKKVLAHHAVNTWHTTLHNTVEGGFV